MDNAVTLVRAYLHVNGYFTVTEYPVLEAGRHGGFRTVTDLDVLAFRFPGAGRMIPMEGTDAATPFRFAPDPVLGCPPERADMVIGEVKEGRARINENMLRPEVLEVVLTRFGCCLPAHAPTLIDTLLRHGRAITHAGHQVRLMVFAASTESVGIPGCTRISLGHVVRFLQDHLDAHWDVLHHTQSKDPAFGFLMILKKALAATGPAVHPPDPKHEQN